MMRRMHASLRPLPVSRLQGGGVSLPPASMPEKGKGGPPPPRAASLQWRAAVRTRNTFDSTYCNSGALVASDLSRYPTTCGPHLEHEAQRPIVLAKHNLKEADDVLMPQFGKGRNFP